MDLKALLKADFGYDVRIASGVGDRAHPYVIDPCSKAEASLTQFQLLQGLGRGRRELWRLTETVSGVDGRPNLQGVGIETVAFTDTQIITEKRRLYFDIAAVDGAPEPLPSATAWQSPQLGFRAPYHLEWLHLDNLINNAQPGEPLDVSLLYSGVGAKASVFVYQGRAPANLDQDVVRETELAQVCQQLLAQHPDAEDPWGVQQAGPLLLRYFILDDQLTAVGLARKDYCFIKLRLTFFDDLKMRQLMTDVTQKLASLIVAI